jgi:hypothetical protein
MILPRFPGSAPGPPPRVRVISGLVQAAMQSKRAMREITERFTSHRLGRKNNDEAKDESAHQD